MRISDWSSDVCSSDLGMDADLPGRCDQPLGNQRLRRAQPVEHVERGRMKGRGPEVVGEPGVGFEDEDGDSLLLQKAGPRQSARPRPEERPVGQALVRTCQSRWRPYPYTQKNPKT